MRKDILGTPGPSLGALSKKNERSFDRFVFLVDAHRVHKSEATSEPNTVLEDGVSHLEPLVPSCAHVWVRNMECYHTRSK